MLIIHIHFGIELLVCMMCVRSCISEICSNVIEEVSTLPSGVLPTEILDQAG